MFKNLIALFLLSKFFDQTPLSSEPSVPNRGDFPFPRERKKKPLVSAKKMQTSE
jgi:hypothetical protein